MIVGLKAGGTISVPITANLSRHRTQGQIHHVRVRDARLEHRFEIR